MSPVYESLCHSLCVDPDDETMDDATHLVNDDCGHWTIRRILALGQTHTGAAIHVTRIAYSEKFSRMRKIEHFANNISRVSAITLSLSNKIKFC